MGHSLLLRPAAVPECPHVTVGHIKMVLESAIVAVIRASQENRGLFGNEHVADRQVCLIPLEWQALAAAHYVCKQLVHRGGVHGILGSRNHLNEGFGSAKVRCIDCSTQACLAFDDLRLHCFPAPGGAAGTTARAAGIL